MYRRPASINNLQAAFTALTGAESSVTTSAACLYARAAPDVQAQAQVAESLVVPALTAAVCMGLWFIR